MIDVFVFWASASIAACVLAAWLKLRLNRQESALRRRLKRLEQLEQLATLDAFIGVALRTCKVDPQSGRVAVLVRRRFVQ